MSEILKNNLKMFNVDDSQDSRVGLGKLISLLEILNKEFLEIVTFYHKLVLQHSDGQKQLRIFLQVKEIIMKNYMLLDYVQMVNGNWMILFLIFQEYRFRILGFIIRKTWAKMNIDYTDIEGGDPREVIKNIWKSKILKILLINFCCLFQKGIFIILFNNNQQLDYFVLWKHLFLKDQVIFIIRIIHKKPLSQRKLQIINKVLNSQSQKLEIIIQMNLAPGKDKIVLCSLDPAGVVFAPKNQLVQ
ncbi:unnamed protein product [Paramecium pentaurelia]|uniref:Uncharacterized protein n=1 Tax=Paramecium pentaurelia TaxID=43138 RepID=A0A8S1WVI6_9CILI|nr:unnamed protein product [Paramecium pentaurelia]